MHRRTVLWLVYIRPPVDVESTHMHAVACWHGMAWQAWSVRSRARARGCRRTLARSLPAKEMCIRGIWRQSNVSDQLSRPWIFSPCLLIGRIPRMLELSSPVPSSLLIALDSCRVPTPTPTPTTTTTTSSRPEFTWLRQSLLVVITSAHTSIILHHATGHRPQLACYTRGSS
jgi:hypothetical protein